MSHIQQIELPDGTVVLARIGTPDGYGADDRDVGVLDGTVAKVEHLAELIGAVGSSVLSAARAVRPDEAAVTFGVELTAKPGRALAVLAEGEARALVQVTLTWRAGRTPPAGAPDQGAPAPASASAPAPAPGAAPAPAGVPPAVPGAAPAGAASAVPDGPVREDPAPGSRPHG